MTSTGSPSVQRGSRWSDVDGLIATRLEAMGGHDIPICKVARVKSVFFLPGQSASEEFKQFWAHRGGIVKMSDVLSRFGTDVLFCWAPSVSYKPQLN